MPQITIAWDRFNQSAGLPATDLDGEGELTPVSHRRTIGLTMQTGFDEAFRRAKELVADFRANEKSKQTK